MKKRNKRIPRDFLFLGHPGDPSSGFPRDNKKYTAFLGDFKSNTDPGDSRSTSMDPRAAKKGNEGIIMIPGVQQRKGRYPQRRTFVPKRE